MNLCWFFTNRNKRDDVFALLPVQWLLAGIFCFCGTGIFSAFAETSAPVENNEIIRYRHWRVPHDKPELWSWDRETLYAPILKTEFASLLELCAPETSDAETPNNCLSNYISSAKYYAELSGNDLLNGLATLEISAGEVLPPEIPIAPLEMWFQATTVSRGEKSFSARLQQTVDNVASLLIPEEIRAQEKNADTPAPPTTHSLKLHGNWSLSGERVSPYRIQFAGNFPQSIASEIILKLPSEWTPQIASGQVITAESRWELADSALFAMEFWYAGIFDEEQILSSMSEWKIWHLVLGNRAQIELTLTRYSNEMASSWHRLAATQTTFWNLTTQGLELSAVVRWGQQNQEIGDLTLECEAPLRLVSVTCNEQIVTAMPLTENSSQYRVMIPPHLLTENCTLEVRAEAPLVGDATWILPRIILDSPAILVHEQSGKVLVEQPLLLEEIALTEGMQTAVSERVPHRDAGEFLSLQFFNNSATVAVKIGQQLPSISWHSGTQVFWNAQEIRAAMTLDVIANGAALYLVELPLSTNWEVESVVSTAELRDKTGAGVQWQIREAVPGARILAVMLPKPLAPNDATLRLVVLARRRGETSSTLENLLPIPPSFSPSTFSQSNFSQSTFSRWGEHVVAIVAGETARLQWNQLGFSTSQLLTASSPPLERRFSRLPEGVFFPLARLTAPLALELIPVSPVLNVQIEARAVVRKQEVEEIYAFRCRPFGSLIEVVNIEFAFAESASAAASATKEIWHWQLRDEDEIPKAQQLGDLPSGKTQWQVKFATPRSTAFELIASRKVPLLDGMALPLPSVINAAQQSAELAIEASGLTNFRFATRLEALAPPATTWGEFSRVRAILRYEPSAEIAAAEPAVQLYHATETLPAAWIWRQRLHSQFESSGVVRNNVTLRVENRGLSSFTLTFPEHFTRSSIRGVWIDEQQMAWSPQVVTEEARALVVTVPLPENRRFVTVVVEYFFQSEPLARQRKLEPILPRVSIPVLNEQWIAWIPPEYRVSHKTTRFGGEIFSLDLFLMPTSNKTQQPFDPLQVFAWKFWQPRDLPLQETKAAVTALLARWNKSLPQKLVSAPSGVSWGETLRDVASGSLAVNGRNASFEMLIDRTSLALWEVTPTSLVAELAEVMREAEILSLNTEAEKDENETLSAQQIFPFAPVTDWLYALGRAAPTSSFTDFPPVHDASMIDRVKRIFDSAGLALLVAPQSSLGPVSYKFYLTTFLNVAAHRDDLVPLFGESVWLISENSSPIISRLQWVGATQWTNDISPVRVAWGANLQEREFVAVTPTWNAYTSIDGAPTRAVYVVPHDTVVAWGWLLFFAVLILTQIKLLAHPVFLLGIIVFAEGAVRNITICYAPIPAGILLGGLCSLAFALIRLAALPVVLRIKSRSLFAPPREDHKLTIVSVILVIAFILLSSFAHAEWSEKKFPPTLNEPHRVLIPTDDSLREIGDTVWISTRFHAELMRYRVRTRPQATNWSLVDALYEGTLAESPASTQTLALQQLQATYIIRVTGPTAAIRFPLLPLAPHAVFWDDLPIEPLYLPQSGVIEFQVSNDGSETHRLKITFLPTVEMQDNECQVRFPIPAVPSAKLQLNYPRDLAPPRVSNLLGGITETKNALTNTKQMLAQLGATSVFHLSWKEKTPTAATVNVEVEQAVWLWCRPHQVNLRAQFAFQVTSGTVQQVSLLLDPRFRLAGEFRCYNLLSERQLVFDKRAEALTEIPLATVETKPLTFAASANPATAHTAEVILYFAAPVSGQILVQADFFLNGFGGLGQVRVPRFSATQANIKTSLLMTSADPTLDIKIIGEDNGSEKSAADFQKVWENFRSPLLNPLPNPDLPHRAFSLQTAQNQWLAAIAAKPLVVSMPKIMEAFAFAGHQVEVLLEAKLEPSRAQFMQTLIMPAGMEIDQIEINDADNQRVDFRSATVKNLTAKNSASETTAAETSRVNLFFKRSLTGNYTLRVRGALRTTFTSAALPLPRIELVDVQPTLESTTKSANKSTTKPEVAPAVKSAKQELASIAIYRTSAVTVRLEKSAWEESPAQDYQPTFSFSDLVFVESFNFTTSPAETIKQAITLPATPHYQLQPNHPQLSGTVWETVNYVAKSGTWEAQFVFDLTLEQGELGVFPLVLDENCSGEIKIEPAKLLRTLSDTVTDGKRQLVLLVNQSVQKHLAFSLTVPLRLQEEKIIIPAVQLERAATLQRYVSIPRLDALKWDWEVRDLQRCTAGTHPNWEQANYDLFAASNPDSGGIGKKKDSAGHIRLWDVRFFVRNDGEFFGFASGDVESGAGREIILQLPPSTSLVEVAVAGVTIPLLPQPQNRLSIRLGAYAMPQAIEVVYRGKIARQNRNPQAVAHQLPLPQITGIQVDETLWSIAWEAASDTAAQFSKMEALTPNNNRLANEEMKARSGFTSRDAMSLQATLAVVRLNCLMSVLENVAKETTADLANLRRWLGVREQLWDEQLCFLDRLLNDFPDLTVSETLLKTLQAALPREPATGSIAGNKSSMEMLFIDSKSIDEVRKSLLFRFSEWIANFHLFFPDANDLNGTQTSLAGAPRIRRWTPLTSIEGWADWYRNDVTFFVGIDQEQLEKVEIKIPAAPQHSWGNVSQVMLVWMGLMIFCLAQAWSCRVRELIAIMPHFWFMWFGLILWMLTPPGGLGLAIVFVAFITLITPLWRYRRIRHSLTHHV